MLSGARMIMSIQNANSYSPEHSALLESEGMHRHTCLACGQVIAESYNFECEVEADHDYELCDDCLAVRLNDGCADV